MFCSKCGAPLEANVSFCPKCGASTSTQSAAPPPAATFAAQPAVVVNVATPVFTCPFCHFQGPPIIEKKVSSNGWIIFVLLLLFCLPLCWLPFVIDGCKEETRTCSSCHTRLS
jgi:hypothetical protein